MATLEEYNQVVVERLAAKQACEAAEGTPEYKALLNAFRVLDHKRDDLRDQLIRDNIPQAR